MQPCLKHIRHIILLHKCLKNLLFNNAIQCRAVVAYRFRVLKHVKTHLCNINRFDMYHMYSYMTMSKSNTCQLALI